MAKILSNVFGILTICGAIYVLATGGKANAGYAVIPMVLRLTFNSIAHKKPKDK
ncbi:hypothetical protein [Desulfosporosinus sp. I2]|uniref:hypothetical protein n=1 Tax=Desulfosporosinus sp. I2 TaxID=1617025 RepID=UPI000A424914|nr:hypothetical protein [Desulfosporosinus sp. I2]